MKNVIVTNNLRAGYDGKIIIPSIDLGIEKNKFISIIGANGCGKSTLLKTIGRIIKAESGKIFLNDRLIFDMKNKDIAKEIAILPQSPNAPSTITCRELVSYGRYPYQKGFGKLSEEDKKIINWALEATRMQDFTDREIGSLSGGQRQRVWIAMALAQQTGILLLDEPTTYLDLAHQIEVLELLKNLNQQQNITVVTVLHDLNLASVYSDYIFAMKDGEIAYKGEPKDVINDRMLEECFGVRANIITDQKTDKPICYSFECIK